MPFAPIPAGSAALCVAIDRELRAALRRALSSGGFDVHEALGEPPSELAPADIAVVSLDDGDTTLSQAWLQRCVAEEIPVLVVGARERCREALPAGAADWFTPPVDVPLLLHRAATVLHMARLAERTAEIDPASAVELSAEGAPSAPSAKGFLEQAETLLRTARGQRDRCSLFAMSLSVEEGNATIAAPSLVKALEERSRAVLVALAGAESRSDGPGTMLALVESHEIVLLLQREPRPQDIYRTARRLQQQLSAPLDVEGTSVSVQVDIGIALHPEDGDSPRDLLRSARRAAARARREQSSGIRFAQPSMDASSFQRLTMESALRSALERRELSVHYQPRVEIATNRVAGFEALLRWQHPELGSVSPAQFIPIAEESGLIVPIGEWVLREACLQNRRWREAGLPHVRVSVNLSPVQFRLDDLESRIACILEETKLDAEALELELTESMLLAGADTTVDTLRMLREMGIRLAIDDFGTGYSSLSYIKHFPIDSLKIDQSFMREVTSSPEDAALTTSIVLLGRNLDLTVVAEGVETRSQLEFLRVLECAEAQGYLFGRPAPPEVAERVLTSAGGLAIPDPT
jgi:EAL domain-containing protein (putative c-di-GMP-specific phosphodiesterase class I)/GGDEF domain-containing protein